MADRRFALAAFALTVGLVVQGGQSVFGSVCAAPKVTLDILKAVAPSVDGDLSSSAPGDGSRSNQQDIEGIRERGQLVIAVVQPSKAHTFPFMAFPGKDGQMVGPDVDLAKNLGKLLGVSVAFGGGQNPQATKTAPKDPLSILASGQADIVLGVRGIDPKIAEKAIYVGPYGQVRRSVLVNTLKMAKMDRSLSATELAKMALQDQGAKPGAPGNESWKKAVENGTAIAVLTDEVTAKKTILESPQGYLKLRSLILPDNPNDLYILVNENSPKLARAVEAHLKENRVFFDGKGIWNHIKKQQS